MKIYFDPDSLEALMWANRIGRIRKVVFSPVAKKLFWTSNGVLLITFAWMAFFGRDHNAKDDNTINLKSKAAQYGPWGDRIVADE
jgi:hypothetical protein